MKNTNKKTPLTVYWAPSSTVENSYQQLLLNLKPTRLIQEVSKNKTINPNPLSALSATPPLGGLHLCTAFHELMTNVFIIRSPFDMEVHLNDEGYIDRSKDYSGWFVERTSSLEGMKSLDMDMYYLFFAEEPVNVTITSPYMHKTSQPDWGFITPVKFDVSKWFRPYGLIFHLWPGVNKLTFKKGEPIAYLHFETKRKIEFKQFYMTTEIFNQARACGNIKHVLPFEPLEKLYDLFFRSGMRTRVLEEVKKHLIKNDYADDKEF
jgi:hypothetical protein